MKSPLPERPLPIIPLTVAIVKACWLLFPRIIGFVALSSLWHLIVPPLVLINPTFAGVTALGFVLLIWYLYAIILIRSNAILSKRKLGLTSVICLAKRRYLWVLGSNLVFFGIGVLMGMVLFALNLTFHWVDLHPLYLLFGMILCVVSLAYFYFAIPEIVLTKTPILKAFEKSIFLVKGNLWRTLIVLGFWAAVILGFEALGILFTGKHRMFLFTGYHFLLQLIFYPFIVSATLLLLNDLKWRKKQDTRPL